MNVVFHHLEAGAVVARHIDNHLHCAGRQDSELLEHSQFVQTKREVRIAHGSHVPTQLMGVHHSSAPQLSFWIRVRPGCLMGPPFFQCANFCCHVIGVS